VCCLPLADGRVKWKLAAANRTLKGRNRDVRGKQGNGEREEAVWNGSRVCVCGGGAYL
jgi:hypothetical protein